MAKFTCPDQLHKIKSVAADVGGFKNLLNLVDAIDVDWDG